MSLNFKQSEKIYTDKMILIRLEVVCSKSPLDKICSRISNIKLSQKL